MDFGKIVSRSFEIAWQHKFLWFFGMLASGGAFNFEFDYLIDVDMDPYGFFENIQTTPEILYPFLTGMLILSGIMFLLMLISEIAVIDSVNRIERGGRYSFGSAFSAGLDYFWRYLGMAIFKVLSLIAVFGIIIFIAVILFTLATALGVLFLIVFIPGGIFILFFFTNVFTLAERSMVVRNGNIMDSIEEGYFLFKSHFSDNFVIFLITFGLAIAFGIGNFIVWAFLGIPIGLIVTALGFNMMTAFVAAFIFGLPISIIIGGILGIFFSNLYTLFYFELVEPKQKTEIPPAQIYGLDNQSPPPPETV